MRKWDKGKPQEKGGVWKLLEGWAQEIGRADREFNGKEFKGKSWKPREQQKDQKKKKVRMYFHEKFFVGGKMYKGVKDKGKPPNSQLSAAVFTLASLVEL